MCQSRALTPQRKKTQGNFYIKSEKNSRRLESESLNLLSKGGGVLVVQVVEGGHLFIHTEIEHHIFGLSFPQMRNEIEKLLLLFRSCECDTAYFKAASERRVPESQIYVIPKTSQRRPTCNY